MWSTMVVLPVVVVMLRVGWRDLGVVTHRLAAGDESAATALSILTNATTALFRCLMYVLSATTTFVTILDIMATRQSKR